jgi:hypothetical protein
VSGLSRGERIAYLIVALYGAFIFAVCSFMFLDDVTGPAQARHITPCATFACIEQAQIKGGVDNAYKSKLGNRAVDCAAKTWEQGPVVICRWSK